MRILSLATTAALVLTSAGCKERQSLAERARARIAAGIPGSTVKVTDSSTLQMKRGDIEVTISLDNLRIQCEAGEEACSAAIDVVVANLKGQHEAFAAKAPIDPKTIRLTLKDRDYLDRIHAMMKEKAPEKFEDNRLVVAPLAGDLSIVYVIDRPQGMQMVQAADLKELKLTQPEVHALAVKNLGEAFPAVKMSEMEGTAVWTNDEGNDYDSALMALPALWKPLAEKVGGKLVVSAPARNRVFATSAADPKRVAAMRTITLKANQSEDHPLSAQLFDWSETGWTTHAP